MTDITTPLSTKSNIGLRYHDRVGSELMLNGVRNQLQVEDAPIHNWYRFVLSFPPHLVRQYLQDFSAKPMHRILDPFSGTGTTLVECKKNGIPSVGIEAHPMPHFAASVKLDWSPSPTGLVRHAEKVAREALEILEDQGIEDNPIFETNQQLEIELENLPPDEEKLLIKNSISPLPLHKTLILRRAIDQNNNSKYVNHEKLALAKVLVTSIGNLHFGPEVGVGKQKLDAPVIENWLHQVHKMAADLRVNNCEPSVDSFVHLADARDIGNLLDENSIDGVFTSPPYPNEKDYTRTTRLESVILGFLDGKMALREVKKNLLRSNTRNVYKDDDDDKWIDGFPEILKIADEIEKKRIALGKTSGFERMYHRVTKQYFGGMYRHFCDLRKTLVPGALLGYVVGDQASYLRVMIRTGQLLSSITNSLGYETVAINLFRTRLSTATRSELREEVLVLRWPG